MRDCINNKNPQVLLIIVSQLEEKGVSSWKLW